MYRRLLFLSGHNPAGTGTQSGARGIYRDAVRSSRSYLVKVSGLRWICLTNNMFDSTGTRRFVSA